MKTPFSLNTLRIAIGIIPFLLMGHCYCQDAAVTGDNADKSHFGSFQNDIVPLLREYCYRCHDAKTQEGDFRLDQLAADFAKERKAWKHIFDLVESGEMPQEKPFLKESDRLKLLEWIVTEQNDVDWSQHKQAGHVTLPRLTLNEYTNTLRDLFDLPNINPAATFTDEGLGDSGFSTDRDALHLDPSKLEKYMAATEDLLDDYYAVHKSPIRDTTKGVDMFCTNAVHTTESWGKILKNPRDAFYFQKKIERSGFYLLSTKAWGYRTNNREATEINFYVDYTQVGRVRLFSSEKQPGLYKIIVWLDKGTHTFRFNPRRRGLTAEESKLPLAPYYAGKLKYAIIDPTMGGCLMAIAEATIEGPLEALPEHAVLVAKDYGDLIPPPHRSDVEERSQEELAEVDAEEYQTPIKHGVIDGTSDDPIPAEYQGEVWCNLMADVNFAPPHEAVWGHSEFQGRKAARDIVGRFMYQSFRRPVSDSEVNKYMKLYDLEVSHSDHIGALKLAQLGVLTSPHFLYHTPQGQARPEDRKLSPFEMASRLSYFLWQSMPDDELFEAAGEGKLHTREEITFQFNRMLQDPRAKNMTAAFAREWLGYRELGATIKPDEEMFTEYTKSLENAMKKESALYFDYVLRKDRSILELVSSDFTFVNNELAAHYNLEKVDSPEHRLVKLPRNSPRGGVFTMGSVLTVTSHPKRTSAVDRGVWVLSTLLGEKLPNPPANIPPLPGKKDEGSDLTFRQLLEKHRAPGQCQACHSKIDPIGFGLENFDAIGRWRDHDGGAKIDASGTLPNGDTFSGPQGLSQVIIDRKDEFTKTFVKAMLTNALGRQLEYFDAPVVDRITENTIKNGYSASSLFEGIINSHPFLYQNSLKELQP